MATTKKAAKKAAAPKKATKAAAKPAKKAHMPEKSKKSFDFLVSVTNCDEGLVSTFKRGGVEAVAKYMSELVNQINDGLGWEWALAAIAAVVTTDENNGVTYIAFESWIKTTASLRANDLVETEARFGLSCDITDVASGLYQMYIFIDDEGQTLYDEGNISNKNGDYQRFINKGTATLDAIKSKSVKALSSGRDLGPGGGVHFWAAPSVN